MTPSALPSELTVDGKRLELAQWQQPSSAPTILLLHEALGSVSYWKDFPALLAGATACSVIAYSRAGHGTSQGPVEARSIGYYRKQVELVIPAVLDHYGIRRPVLYGHSEGAGIAMLYAASGAHVRAIIAECPIVAPEPRTAETIQQLQAGYQSSDMGRRLARYHANPDEVFHSWIASSGAGFSKEFPFERYLEAIRCPLLVLQGGHDEFASIHQYDLIRRYVPEVQHRLYQAGHLLHRELPDEVAVAVATFLANVPSGLPGELQVSQT